MKNQQVFAIDSKKKGETRSVYNLVIDFEVVSSGVKKRPAENTAKKHNLT